ncbi:MAG: hypothetical protein WCF65_03290 [Parachlamydiaceae bacterium]
MDRILSYLIFEREASEENAKIVFVHRECMLKTDLDFTEKSSRFSSLASRSSRSKIK